MYGYEIHHGRTEDEHLPLEVQREDGANIGVRTEDGMIWGTYLHGIFDGDAFRRWFIDRARTRKGLEPMGRILAKYDIDPALDRLAAVVRDALDMTKVYGLLGL